ncbi:hypothetical protein LUZ60_015206 [Juncus effusus]|nr:hypothetical protein LUZ60_015206 [Juncus effusus]
MAYEEKLFQAVPSFWQRDDNVPDAKPFQFAQALKATYVTTVDNKEYGYYDQVENYRSGVWNGESIASLVWGFFHYWAYQHDYATDVISIRTCSVISKHEKDWTRWVGNDRHLICIEDPFEPHDLGRVVTNSPLSIETLREEFERAANIMQYDRNPTVALFEKYVPPD